MREIPFHKLSGTGNDFIIVDNRDDLLEEASKGAWARAVCDRRQSVGADGVLLLEDSGMAHFRMRLFNPDGSEGEMCGNGARCIARYAYEAGVAPADMRIETRAGIVEGKVEDGWVRLRLWQLNSIAAEVRRVRVEGQEMDCYYLEVGVPHAVVFVSHLRDTPDAEIFRLGRAIRFAPAFPKGANVNFVEVKGPHDLEIRTYERGVEYETLACGTGSVAASLVAHQVHAVEPTVSLLTRGGRVQVSFQPALAGWDVFLAGEVRRIMAGRIFSEAWNREEAPRRGAD